jgi:Vitamin K-dependent gamma-carboxylase
MTARALRPADGATTRGQFTIFAFLLAAATVFHEAALGELRVTHALVTLAALWVLLRPSSLTRFLVLVAAQLVVFADDLPHVVNHWLVLAVTNLVVVAYIAWAAIGRREWPIRTGALYQSLAPILRLELILVYLFAALAKMNEGFFDELNSCALVLSRDLFAGAFTPPGLETVGPVLMIATIVIELGLAVTLVIPRTRVPAIFVGLGFHAMLAVSGHAAFSGFAIAFYCLFLPDDMPERLLRVRDRYAPLAALSARAARWSRLPAAGAIVVGACAAAVAVGALVVPRDDWRQVADVLVILAFLAFTLAVAGLLALALRDPAPLRWRPGMFRVAHPLLAVAPLVVLANGFSPYLGLKTENSFTMYSNLRTEGTYWNHWFMPQSMQVFDMQDRPVRVIASSEERLQRTAADGKLMTRFAFESHASRHPDDSVTYVMDGQMREVTRIGSDPLLAGGPSAVLDKVLWFRDIPIAQGSFCTR